MRVPWVSRHRNSRWPRASLGPLAPAMLAVACGAWALPAFADEAANDDRLIARHAETEARLPAFLRVDDAPLDDQNPDLPALRDASTLQALQREVDRFVHSGTSYRDTITALVRRHYHRQRRDYERLFNRQIEAEERIAHSARERAIDVIERFLEEFPDDTTYTADALYRLGELYFERTSVTYQLRMEQYFTERDRRLESGEDTGDLLDPEQNFTPTLRAYRRIVREYPNYERLDAVFYLIGYCLSEMGQPEEANLAWLASVCANQHRYTAERTPDEAADESDDADVAYRREHPALTLDSHLRAPAGPQNSRDAYEACQPLLADSRFNAEVWLRIGEYHFDFDYGRSGLDRAISAYTKVLGHPEDRNYNLGLYKLAWAFYRASRYPEAIQRFGDLVQWSDDQHQRTGRAGSELRAEALKYLGIAFAFDDWNENHVPDPEEGLPHGIDRLQDPELLPQDRAWTPEVYEQVGHVYFDEAKYAEAIAVWELALERWPLHRQAPAVQNMIARAHTRFNQPKEAMIARAKLSDYGIGSAWWNANLEHPAEQRVAERLSEDALIGPMLYHHQHAQELRRICVNHQDDPELCRHAHQEYRIAARGYREYLERFPHDSRAYDFRFNLADALYWSENYAEAAQEYAAVRDSSQNDSHLASAARLVVESHRRLYEQAAAAGQAQRRHEPPEPHGDPPTVLPLAVPEALQRLAHARETYLVRVSDDKDVEQLRHAYDLNNTLLLYFYGYWEPAKHRFTRIYAERCRGPRADDTGRLAWLNLRNMAVALNDSEEVRRLGYDLQQRQCSFAPDESRVSIDCSDIANRDEPQCLAGSDFTNLRYQAAVELFRQAERAEGEEQRTLYERSAAQLLSAVNEEPDHPQAPLALEKAAIALERISRFESAGRLYQRIIDEVAPLHGETPEEQESLDAITSNAHFRLAYNANRFFDYELAVENYRTLADSQRFETSTAPGMQERREGALINAARILEFQQDYDRALAYYQRAAQEVQDPDDRRIATFRVAEMQFRMKHWFRALRDMRAFLKTYEKDPAAAELVVQAYWRMAQIQERTGTPHEYRRALEAVVAAFGRSGLEPGVYAAEYAAEAQFLLVDKDSRSFESFAIRPGTPATLDRYVKVVVGQIESGANSAKEYAQSYDAVVEYRRPSWMIAGFVRQGRIYEVLARAVLNAPFVVPADLQKQMRRLPDYAQEDVRIQVEDTIRQVLDAKVRPIECLAVARYALAARAARAGNIDDEYTREATDRINAYGDERIAECIAEAAARDASMAPYVPGEFTRAPRGHHLPIPPGTSPPTLTGGVL